MSVNILSWVASIVLMWSLLDQILHIHRHKEVRDISLKSILKLVIGSVILGVEAVMIGSGVFLFKQLGTVVLACVILYQIRTHRKDRWKR